MLLSIAGLNSQLGLRLTDVTRTQQLAQLQNEPQNQRMVQAFVEEIGSVSTPKDLTDNFQVYSFVMRAFDLEDQIFGRGLMRKVFESDANDQTSLVNRLTDTRFRVIHEALGFAKDDAEKPDFSDPAWQAGIIDRYYTQVFENNASDQNPTVGAVLKVRREAPEISNWFQVLRDSDLSEFFRTTLGLPEQMASVDIDKQASIFDNKFDLQTLRDPEVLDQLINRYVALSDIKNPPVSVSSSAISLLNSSSGLGVIVSLNVPQVTISASALFR